MRLECKLFVNGTLIASELFRKRKGMTVRQAVDLMVSKRGTVVAPAWYSIAGPSHISRKVYRSFIKKAPALVYRTSITCVHRFTWTKLLATKLDKWTFARHVTRKEFDNGVR